MSSACDNVSVAQGISDLVVDGFNASEMSISWSPPVLLNGPSPVYVIKRYSPAFNTPPQRVEIGYHFTGVNYFSFPPETIPQGVTFTGTQLQIPQSICDMSFIKMANVNLS